MAFVTASLLMLGTLLVAVPIVLHLVMRRKPKQLIFPALRFVKQRRNDNRRRLQLRHWLLLALRCGAIALAAAALARPSVASAMASDWALVAGLGIAALVAGIIAAFAVVQKVARWITYGLAALAAFLALGCIGFTFAALYRGSDVLIGHEESPVSAALVIDTSPRMLYRHQNKTRLEEARDTATWLLGELPHDSQVGVVDSHPGVAAMATDQAAAKAALDRLQPAYAPQKLSSMLLTAMSLVKQSAQQRKEIYLFTDLTAAGWEFDATELKAKLAEMPEVLLYVIDLGVESPQNLSLGTLELSSQTLSKNSLLELATEVRCLGAGGNRLVELSLEEPDATRPLIRDGKAILPEPKRRSRESVTLAPGEPARVQFQLRGLDIGTHQGFVKILGEDGLPVDDTRYFTVEVRPPWPVLVAAPPGTITSFVTEALAPYEFRQTGQARFTCQVIPQAELAGKELGGFAAMCLLDPAPMPAPVWQALADYVRSGGGVALFLGPKSQPLAAFNEAEPQQLLPGKLWMEARTPGEVYLAPRALEHPLLARFRTLETSIPWAEFPVRKHWVFKPPVSGTVVSYSNNLPALLEKSLGDGRVLTFTTPLSEPSRPVGREAWNQLATGFEPWPFVMLTNEMLLYLTGSGDTKLNYTAGETAVLTNRLEEWPQRYQLFTPDGATEDVTATENRVTVKFAEAPGAYRLKGLFAEQVQVRGFCVNLPPEATALARTERTKIDEVIGKDRYQYAQSRGEIRRDIGVARVGREFYPFLLLFLALILGLEQLLANRFYTREET